MYQYTYQDLTHKYPKRVQALLKELEAWLDDLSQGDGAFFAAPNVWQAREEEYCLQADAIMAIDGSVLYEALNYGMPAFIEEQFSKILNKHGYFYELGTSWYLGLYPINPNAKLVKTPKKKVLTLEEVTLDTVKVSTFGCRNCLYAGAECVNYSRFVPKIWDNKPTCVSYWYYD